MYYFFHNRLKINYEFTWSNRLDVRINHFRLHEKVFQVIVCLYWANITLRYKARCMLGTLVQRSKGLVLSFQPHRAGAVYSEMGSSRTMELHEDTGLSEMQRTEKKVCVCKLMQTTRKNAKCVHTVQTTVPTVKEQESAKTNGTVKAVPNTWETMHL